MATIKEMAKYYVTIKDGKETYVNSIKRKSFEAGAKAVIEEIEKCSSYDAFCQARRMGCISEEYFWRLHQISKKIKELRD